MSDAVTAAARAAHPEHCDPEASRFGMWLFLTTEILLFGVLFIVYAVYYNQYHIGFRAAARELNRALGALNTVVLLTSSLTMALSLAALQRRRRQLSVRLLGATLLCAAAFLVVKAFEWRAKFEHGLYPGSPLLLDLSKGETLFIGLYFMCTGLHAFHVAVGIVLIAVVLWRVRIGAVHSERIALLENSGLYWHLVDIVWIYIFPLFYLIT